MIRRMIGIFLSGVLTLGLLSCAPADTGVPETGEAFEFPLKEKVKLTFFANINRNLLPDYETLAEHPLFQRMGRRTNVYFEFIHPSKDDIGTARSEYLAMVSAGNLPDVFTPLFFWYPGGIDLAIGDGVYINLRDRIPTHMPNLDAMMRENAQIGKLITSTEGNIGWIPAISGLNAEGAPPTMGMMIRQDMLEELQLEVPETIDEWYETMKKLKVSGQVESPLTFGGYLELGPTLPTFSFLSAYGVNSSFYLGEDGKVRYAPVESGVKEYVTLLNKWYTEKLLSLEVPAGLTQQQYYSSDETAAFYGNYTQFSLYSDSAPNPKYKLAGTPHPVLKKGESVHIYAESSPVSGNNIGSFYISPTNPYPNETMKYFDQFYTEEMMMESSYGLRNEDYKLVDKKPVFTDKIMKYENGPQFGIAHNTWNAAPMVVPLVDLQVYAQEAQDAVNNRWRNVKLDRMLPASQNMFFTPDEQLAFEALTSSCWGTSIYEMRRFIEGTRPLSEWDDYIDQMYSAGAEDYLALKQISYDRYIIN